MELNEYHLCSFSNSMIKYLNEFSVQKNCVSFSFRKNNIKNNEDIEFSFFLKLRKDFHSNSDKSFKRVDSSFLSKEELKEIINISKTWSLHLAEISLKESKLCLKLHKPYAFYVIIQRILNQKSSYGCLCSKKRSEPNVMSNASGSGSEMSKRRALPGTSSAVVTPDLASLFECPVCFDYVLPPILQCQSGHLVCSSCRPKLTCCPTCRGPLGNIRNLAMEKVASTVMFPCKYAATGCSVLQLYSEKVEHEEICEFRPFQCPCPGASCKWLGSLDQVMPHLVSSHKSITTLQGEDIVFLATDINLPGAVDWVMMQSCFGHCFMLVLEKQEKFDGHQQFFALVQLIGSRKQAENFGYRLELNRQRRRLTWEATPRSIHEGIATAIVSSDCLVFDTSVAQLFADNGNLGINVTISLVR